MAIPRRIIRCFVLLFVFVPVVQTYSEPLSKIAVIYLDKVLESFPEDARVFRRIEELTYTYETRMEEYAIELDAIELELLAAKENGDEIEVAGLEATRADFVENQRTYHEIMNRQIKRAYDEIYEVEGIAEEIMEAIRFIAINEGYSLVLDAEDPRLYYFSKEIDVTDMVISRLRAVAFVEQ